MNWKNLDDGCIVNLSGKHFAILTDFLILNWNSGFQNHEPGSLSGTKSIIHDVQIKQCVTIFFA